MKTIYRLLLGMLLGSAPSLFAQELPRSMRPQIASTLNTPLQLELMPLSLHGFQDPTHQWQMWQLLQQQETETTRNRLAKRSLQPVKKLFQAPKQTFQVKVRIASGNCISNWSPYPDRALDARVIRYPMPQPHF